MDQKPSLTIAKIGGGVIEDPIELKAFLKDFSTIKGPKILVHGGGRDASKMEARLGIETQMHQGRRITSAESLEVISMVYAGKTNKTIVALLQSLNCNAIGLSGADANCIRSHKRTGTDIDYGFVGDIDSVQADHIAALTEHFCPVFCAITHDGKGQLLNTNADTIAAAIASAMSKTHRVSLYYCFEKQGVLLDIDNPNSLVQKLDNNYYQQLLQEGVIAAGMIPKLKNCFEALDNGVSKVVIGPNTLFGDTTTKYTQITRG
jgi:acetylglutamate kinase